MAETDRKCDGVEPKYDNKPFLAHPKKIAGLPHFRFHDHEALFGQHPARPLGIPDAYIMQRGGWQTDGVLKAVYRHTMSDRQEEMNDRGKRSFYRPMQHEMQHKKKNP